MKSIVLKNKHPFSKELVLESTSIDVSGYEFIYDVNDLRVIKNTDCIIHLNFFDIYYIKGHNTYVHNRTHKAKLNDIEHLNKLNISGVYIDMSPEKNNYSYANKWELHYNGCKFKVSNFPIPSLFFSRFYYNKTKIFYGDKINDNVASNIDENLIIGLLSYCWFYFYYDSHIISMDSG